MTMIKCPECRHHISSLAKACPECGAPIDAEWAQQEAERELKKLEEVPFTVEVPDGDETLRYEDDNINENETLRYENENVNEKEIESAEQTTPLP